MMAFLNALPNLLTPALLGLLITVMLTHNNRLDNKIDGFELTHTDTKVKLENHEVRIKVLEEDTNHG
jgi:hypothetical protein